MELTGLAKVSNQGTAGQDSAMEGERGSTTGTCTGHHIIDVLRTGSTWYTQML